MRESTLEQARLSIRRNAMRMFKCGECETEFAVGQDVDGEEVECPRANCRSDDIIEFVEADDDDEEEEDDDDA